MCPPSRVVVPTVTSHYHALCSIVQVPVTTKDDLDLLLGFTPFDWATNYTGTWVTLTTLQITVLEVPPADAAQRSATAVGALTVVVKAKGGLTSFDGTSAPCSDSTTVTAGSWGDIACDGGVFPYSATSLVVAFQLVLNVTATPVAYVVEASPGALFLPGETSVWTMTTSQSRGDVVLPTSVPSTALRFVLPGLATGVPYVLLLWSCLNLGPV